MFTEYFNKLKPFYSWLTDGVDTPAEWIGLIIGIISLFTILWGLYKWISKPYPVLLRVSIPKYLQYAETVFRNSEFIPRKIPSFGGSEYCFSSDKDGFVPQNKEHTALIGNGGRGKTVILNMVGMAAMSKTADQLPIYISLISNKTSLLSLILENLGPISNDVANEKRLLRWLKPLKCILLIDDWEQASQETRDQVCKDIDKLSNIDITYIFASRDGIKLPRKINNYINIPELRDDEAENLITHRLANHPNIDYNFVKRKLSGDLSFILHEPVFLSNYLLLITTTDWGNIIFPKNVYEILDALFYQLLSTKDNSSDTQIDLVYETNRKAVKIGLGFSLSDIEAIVDQNSVSADSISNDMVQIGLWKKQRPGYYKFAHEIWHSFFKVIDDCDSSSDSLNNVQATLNDEPANKLQLYCQILVGYLKNPQKQIHAFNLLLDTDIQLYLLALRSRSECDYSNLTDTDRIRLILEQIHQGRIEFTEKYFSKMLQKLFPWNLSNKSPIPSGYKLSLAGYQNGNSLQYEYSLVQNNLPQILVSSSFPDESLDHLPLRASFLTLDHEGLASDSSRILSAKDVLNEIKEIYGEKHPIPHGWLLKETIYELLRDAFSLSGFRNWENIPFNEIMLSLSEALGKGHFVSTPETPYILDIILGGEQVKLQFYRPEDIDAFSVVPNLIGELTQDEIKLTPKVFLLPEPDIDYSSIKSGFFSDCYSPELKIEFVYQFFTRLRETYKEHCELLFPEVNHHFFYNRGPFRPVVFLNSYQRGGSGFLSYWEPVESWDEPPIVKPQLPDNYRRGNFLKDLYHRLSGRYRELGRSCDSVSYSDQLFIYSNRSPLVTEELCKMLKADIDKLIKMLS